MKVVLVQSKWDSNIEGTTHSFSDVFVTKAFDKPRGFLTVKMIETSNKLKEAKIFDLPRDYSEINSIVTSRQESILKLKENLPTDVTITLGFKVVPVEIKADGTVDPLLYSEVKN